MATKKYMTPKDILINKSKVSVLICLFLYVPAFSQEKGDSLLIEYFHKTISIVNRDSSDSLKLRSIIFELIDSKKVATTYDDIINLIGNPMHIYNYKNGNKILIYPESPLFRKNRGGSDLYLFFVDKDNDLVFDAGHTHFIETEEDFYYWISPDLPLRSNEGDKNCPPSFN